MKSTLRALVELTKDIKPTDQPLILWRTIAEIRQKAKAALGGDDLDHEGAMTTEKQPVSLKRELKNR